MKAPLWKCVLIVLIGVLPLMASAQGQPESLLQLIRREADQGDAGAQSSLGTAYFEGIGVPQDYAEAARWWRRAANQGYGAAQGNLGLLYANGQGVPQDHELAYLWLNLAASQSTTGAEFELRAKARDRVAGKLTPEQLARVQRMAREWRSKPER